LVALNLAPRAGPKTNGPPSIARLLGKIARHADCKCVHCADEIGGVSWEETMAARADYVTKKDLEAFATKKDLEAFATKKDLEETNDRVRANGIMLERLDSKVDAVIELLGTLASKSDLAELDVKLSERISRLESVVRQNTDDIRANTEDLRLLRNEVAQLRLQFDRRDLRADELERRIARLEKRAGIARR
jgi:hypothetical protein